MNKAQKALVVDKMNESISPESAILIARYEAISHKNTEDMRKELRNNDCHMMVVRNSLVKIFTKSRNCEELTQDLKKQNIMMWGDDLLRLIKVACDSEKKFENFVPMVALSDSQVIGRDYIKSLASVPSSDHLYAKLIGVINSSITGVSKVLQFNARKLLLALGKRTK